MAFIPSAKIAEDLSARSRLANGYGDTCFAHTSSMDMSRKKLVAPESASENHHHMLKTKTPM
eukprot:1269556-Amphidinium_carterae.1